MGFFDLNIPYPEPSPPSNNKSTIESNRTKLAVKAMELGYTGIAYNRTIKGVMSDHHRCSISPLTLSSLLKVLPFLSLSAKLHRDLLGIPSSTPFRQYTRLTVVVDSSSQAQALNSGNPILKTYDLVAVKPLNQMAFDLACEKMEADIISIDFSSKLPFRLKQPMVKAAAQRGVCFEVTYSGLIADSQIRRQLISSAKLLMEWTRGRNIVFSSAAPSVNELRGPCDVANLLSLFGLSKEQAKAAVSKNCRSLLANSLRKKRFFKEAIRVEVLSSDAASHSKEVLRQELLKWDPISSEGDILLDDMAKSNLASSKASKTAKAIDFVSMIDNLPSHGFQMKDCLPPNDAIPVFPDNKQNSPPVAEDVNQSTPVPNNIIEHPDNLDFGPQQDAIDNIFEKNIHNGTSEAFNSKGIDIPINAAKLELKNSIDSDVLMNDLEIVFSASRKAPKTAKVANNAIPAFRDNEVDLMLVSQKINQSKPALPNNLTVQPNRLDVCPEQEKSSLSDTLTTPHVVSSDKIFEKNIHSGGTTEAFNSKKEIETLRNATKLELKNSFNSDVGCIQVAAKTLDPQSDLCISSNAVDALEPHFNKKMHRSSEDGELDIANNTDHKEENFTQSMDIIIPALVHDTNNSEKRSDVNFSEQIDEMLKALPNKDLKIAEHKVLEVNTSISDTVMEDEQVDKRETDAVELDEMQQQSRYDQKKTDDDSIVAMHVSQDIKMEDKRLFECTNPDDFASGHSVSGRLRVKRKRPRGPLLFPFKRMLNPKPFKKKGNKIKSRTNLK